MLITTSSLVGQKSFEIFLKKKKKKIKDKKDNTVFKIKLSNNLKKKNLDKKILKNSTLEILKKNLKKLVSQYRYSPRQNRISHII